jgi:endonuclease YncB( thermonuclease family)
MLKAFALLLISTSALAETFTGLIVHVADGDTVTLLVQKQQIRIRLAGIDAPEKAQAFGNCSKENLEKLTHSREAIADCPKNDKYGRHVCKVYVQPPQCSDCEKTLDAGLEQIRAGFAWWYRAYANEQSAEDRELYEQAENDARLRKRGLWIDDKPVPPWDWRRK